jgi:hypothetical protein
VPLERAGSLEPSAGSRESTGLRFAYNSARWPAHLTTTIHIATKQRPRRCILQTLTPGRRPDREPGASFDSGLAPFRVNGRWVLDVLTSIACLMGEGCYKGGQRRSESRDVTLTATCRLPNFRRRCATISFWIAALKSDDSNPAPQFGQANCLSVLSSRTALSNL